MASWILFETTDSVIEVLWDVALAFFVVRLALLYAGLILLSTWSLLYLLHHLPASLLQVQLSHCAPWLANNPHLVTSALTSLSSFSAAWFLVRRYEVPRVWAFRLAVGVTGAVVGLGMEAVVRGFGYEVWGWEKMRESGVMMGGGWKRDVGAMGAVAAMPVLVMGLERCWETGGVALRDRQRGEVEKR
jgi:hypothetical protein